MMIITKIYPLVKITKVRTKKMSSTGKKISIEVGHGGGDPGAVKGNVFEKNINLEVGLELKRHLERHGVSVLINRTTDTGFKVADFLAKAKIFSPDAGISVHANAFNGTAKGFEVFRNTNSFKTTSTLLCANIESQVKKLGQTSRGIKDSPFLMSSLSCPTAYCELGFLDNPADYSQFDTAVKQKSFAAAYAKGILEYLGIAWVNESAGAVPNTSASAVPANKSGTMYRVVSGSFSVKSNAQNRVDALKSKGFDAFILEA
jgi:N-acetylmuramoyl-L-alanine amidase